MAHNTNASGEYPWPPDVTRIIYDYYFDAPKILTADHDFHALCVDGTLFVRPHGSGVYTYTDIESITSNDLDPGALGTNMRGCVVVKRSGDVFAWGQIEWARRRAWGNFDHYAYVAIEQSRARGAYPTSVYHTPRIFAVLFSNGDQVFWGDRDKWQPNLGKLDLSKVDTLFANKSWFAALMKDKTVQTWPAKDAELENQMNIDSKELDGVVSIYSTLSAFAAVREDGVVVTWGDRYSGGDSSVAKGRLNKVQHIFTTDGAFAALNGDGTVVTWGQSRFGGDSNDVSKGLQNVVGICATDSAFAAWGSDGTVVTWGGDTSSSGIVAELSPVLDIKSTERRFGAWTLDNQFVTWKHPDTDIEFPVQEALGSRHITQIHSNRRGFAVIADATAFTPYVWSMVEGLNVDDIGSRPLTRVVSVDELFLATNDNGDVVTWGGRGFILNKLTDIINKHQKSIREAFKSATGMK